MKETGIVKRIDDLGRIVIPKEIRKMIFGTSDASGKSMEFFVYGNNIVLKKYEIEEIRAKAIDETIEKMKNWLEETTGLSIIDIRDIDEIAEQLKGGAE